MWNNKKAIVMEEIIFLVLNAIFFIVLLVFIVSSVNGKAVLEQKYAKQIALLIDEAKPKTIIYLDMRDAIEKATDKKNAVKINEQENKVIVKLSSGRGYVFNYFNDVGINYRLDGNNLFLEIKEKENV